jgi:hypothetical protein
MTLYTCIECRQTTIPPRLVESTDRGGIYTVPPLCDACRDLARALQHSNTCPTCGVLRFAGPADEPAYTGPCAACVQSDRAPQGEAVRLFTPAPAQLPGQLNL